MFRTFYDEDSKIWNGTKTVSYYNPDVSVGQVLLESLRRDPDKIGQISDNNGIKLSNNEIRLKSIRAAQHLRAIGIKKGDIAVIIASNHHHLAPIVIALMSLAAPVMVLHVTFTVEEFIEKFKLVQPKVIFTDIICTEMVEQAALMTNLNVPMFSFDPTANNSTRIVDELFAATGSEEYFTPTDIGDGTKHPVGIMCTSGTTGPSKAVCISHAALLENMLRAMHVSADRVAYSSSTLYWNGGYIVLLASTLFGMTRIITTENFSPELEVHIIKTYKVTTMIGPPERLIATLNSPDFKTPDLFSLREYFCVSTTFLPELYTFCKQFMPHHSLYPSYGLSEAPGPISLNNCYSKTNSVGQLVNDAMVKIIDGDHRCGIGEIGELYFQLKYPFLGYYGDPETTANQFDSDGWLKSGDTCYFDEDGDLYVVDRKKDLLQYCGTVLIPSIIENIIMKHKGVEKVCVVGVPDVECIHLPAAVIVRKMEHDVLGTDIHSLVQDYVNDDHRLRGGIYFVNELPSTISGKVIRSKVREIITSLRNKQSN